MEKAGRIAAQLFKSFFEFAAANIRLTSKLRT
jgi:hypothetical protein